MTEPAEGSWPPPVDRLTPGSSAYPLVPTVPRSRTQRRQAKVAVATCAAVLGLAALVTVVNTLEARGRAGFRASFVHGSAVPFRAGHAPPADGNEASARNHAAQAMSAGLLDAADLASEPRSENLGDTVTSGTDSLVRFPDAKKTTTCQAPGPRVLADAYVRASYVHEGSTSLTNEVEVFATPAAAVADVTAAYHAFAATCLGTLVVGGGNDRIRFEEVGTSQQSVRVDGHPDGRRIFIAGADFSYTEHGNTSYLTVYEEARGTYVSSLVVFFVRDPDSSGDPSVLPLLDSRILGRLAGKPVY